mgnify:CR=1 FL=1
MCAKFCWISGPLTSQLRKWADCVLIAPLSANTLAKLANGLADNLLVRVSLHCSSLSLWALCVVSPVQTCIMRAWPVGRKPWLVAPAMNTAMWEHPLTTKQCAVLCDELSASLIPPKGSSTLACGDTGAGAMAGVDTILQAVSEIGGFRSTTTANAAGHAAAEGE